VEGKYQEDGFVVSVLLLSSPSTFFVVHRRVSRPN